MRAVSPLPRLCHPTFPLSSSIHHIFCHPSHHPTHHLPHHPFSLIPPAHPVTCYAHRSHMTRATTGSAQLFANLLSNHSCIVRQALPMIVTTHFGVIHESSICIDNFYDMLYFILQIIPYMSCSPSIRLSCHVQTFLENTYIQLQLNLV